MRRSLRRHPLRRDRLRRPPDRALLCRACAGRALGHRRALGAPARSVACGPGRGVAGSHRRRGRRRRCARCAGGTGPRRAQHRGAVCAPWQRTGRRLRAPGHALRRHHRRDAVGAPDDRPPPRRGGRERHPHRARLRLRFGAVGPRRLAGGACAAATARRALRPRQGLFLDPRRAQRRHRGVPDQRPRPGRCRVARRPVPAQPARAPHPPTPRLTATRRVPCATPTSTAGWPRS